MRSAEEQQRADRAAWDWGLREGPGSNVAQESEGRGGFSVAIILLVFFFKVWLQQSLQKSASPERALLILPLNKTSRSKCFGKGTKMNKNIELYVNDFLHSNLCN